MKSIVEKAREIVTQLYERNMVSWNDLDREVVFAIQALNAEVQRMEALAQPATVHITWNSEGVRTVNGVPDYTPPAAQPAPVQWVGLTVEQIGHQAKKSNHEIAFALGAFWAEAKLKEKTHERQSIEAGAGGVGVK